MLGIIGGSGFYQADGLEVVKQWEVQTPYGAPSAPLTRACHRNGSEVIFLPRHGSGHGLIPSEINYRANIWALKASGVKQAVAVSAVGSLRQDIAPGDFVIPAQYIDHTKGRRASTFFGDGLVAHVSTAQPVCPVLSAALMQAAAQYTVHKDKTYVCVEGPRLGTRAESYFLRDGMNADIVGMTNVPEVFLAREAQISYTTLAVVTDYDCWMDDPAQHVTVQQVIARFGASIACAKQVIAALSAAAPPPNDEHRCVLHSSILTPPAAHSEAHQALLKILQT